VTTATTARERLRTAVVLAAGGFIAFLLASVVAGTRDPASWELRSFRLVNDLPEWLNVPLWPLMQYGSLAAIPLLAAAAWVLRRRPLAVGILVAALTGYLLAKVAKEVVERGRPADYLAGVTEREDFGTGSLGYPSGHAVVAATITAVCFTHLPAPGRVVAVLLTAAVLVGRVYVGGHLALDMVGGAALGVGLGSVSALVVGATARRSGSGDDA
jgi:membrane-associated phospholipid phosphatase